MKNTIKILSIALLVGGSMGDGFGSVDALVVASANRPLTAHQRQIENAKLGIRNTPQTISETSDLALLVRDRQKLDDLGLHEDAHTNVLRGKYGVAGHDDMLHASKLLELESLDEIGTVLEFSTGAKLPHNMVNHLRSFTDFTALPNAGTRYAVAYVIEKLLLDKKEVLEFFHKVKDPTFAKGTSYDAHVAAVRAEPEAQRLALLIKREYEQVQTVVGVGSAAALAAIEAELDALAAAILA